MPLSKLSVNGTRMEEEREGKARGKWREAAEGKVVQVLGRRGGCHGNVCTSLVLRLI
jgi:hypothetical protein